jgi:hypothetical protein
VRVKGESPDHHSFSHETLCRAPNNTSGRQRPGAGRQARYRGHWRRGPPVGAYVWLAARPRLRPFGYHEEITAEPVPVTRATPVGVDPVPPALMPRSRPTGAIALLVSPPAGSRPGNPGQISSAPLIAVLQKGDVSALRGKAHCERLMGWLVWSFCQMVAVRARMRCRIRASFGDQPTPPTAMYTSPHPPRRITWAVRLRSTGGVDLHPRRFMIITRVRQSYDRS